MPPSTMARCAIPLPTSLPPPSMKISISCLRRIFWIFETLKDVTVGELQYVIGNILRSSRYGAISSRLGRVRNTIAAMIFSDTEIFSNLELTQYVYDALLDRQRGQQEELDVPLADQAVLETVQQATGTLLTQIVGRLPLVVQGEALERVIDETIALYREPERVKALLQEIEQGYSQA